MKRLFFILTLLTLLLPGAMAQAVELKNPGFEGAYQPLPPPTAPANPNARITGRIAPGWTDNSDWADVAVDYGAETANPHRGKAAQRVSVARVSGGAVQFVQPVDFKKGRVYAFHVWLRGQPGAGVSLMLRQGGAPYTVYAERRAALSAEWQEFQVAGQVSEDSIGYLMMIAREPMTFYVDDARLDDLTETSSNKPPTVGSLISGGSFEAGMPFGWSTRLEGPPRHAFEDPRPVIDAATAAQGRQSFRIDIPEGDNAAIRSPLFSYHPNRVHTVSLWLKADAPNTPVRVEVEKTPLGQDVRVGTAWTRYAVSGTLPYLPNTRLRVYCAAPEGGPGVKLWLDGAQVEEGATASADYYPQFPADLILTLPCPGRVVYDGEAARIQISMAGPVPNSARLRLSVLDLYGKRVELPDVVLPAASMTLPNFSNRPRGMFNLRGQIVDRAGMPVSAPIEMVWARLPRPRAIDPEKSYFGLHIPLSPRYIAIAHAVGARRVRLHDTSMIGKWAIAEPTEGKFEFFDAGITAAHEAGLSVLGMLDGAPRWTTTKPREGYWGIWNIPDKPGMTDRWANYVRQVVGHYKGRIDDWEVWNEPWGDWWINSGNPNATPQLYGQLLRLAYQNAKQANPRATVLGIDTFRGFNKWTEGALASAGPDFYDGFSYHDYNDALYGGPNNFAQTQAQQFVNFQAKHGRPKPLWITEGGPGQIGSFYAPENGGLGPREQLGWAVRFDVTQMAAGVRAFYLYAIHTDSAMGEIEYRATEHDDAIRPILAARAVLASLVDGAGRPTRSEPVPGVDAYAYPPERGKSVTVLWSYDGATHLYPVPRNARALDVQGNPIMSTVGVLTVGAEPVYLIR